MLWVVFIFLLAVWGLGTFGRLGGTISHLLLLFAGVMVLLSSLVQRKDDPRFPVELTPGRDLIARDNESVLQR